MTNNTTAEVSEAMIEAELFAFLNRKYTQSADGRQAAMGLQYMEAETHDLARELSRFVLAMQSERLKGDGEVEALKHDLERVMARENDYLNEVERLRKALTPFANYADHRRVMPSDLEITNGSSMAKRQLTMGDCYNALAALSPPSDGVSR